MVPRSCLELTSGRLRPLVVFCPNLTFFNSSLLLKVLFGRLRPAVFCIYLYMPDRQQRTQRGAASGARGHGDRHVGDVDRRGAGTSWSQRLMNETDDRWQRGDGDRGRHSGGRQAQVRRGRSRTPSLNRPRGASPRGHRRGRSTRSSSATDRDETTNLRQRPVRRALRHQEDLEGLEAQIPLWQGKQAWTSFYRARRPSCFQACREGHPCSVRRRVQPHRSRRERAGKWGPGLRISALR